ncbi:LysM peptidoglycan-binding domain-containing protein [Spirosoma sordidisoli]|uniref:LysM peptidoglycan-binding domain-containing protein n=1 Tax=Spirosoma sordidisoli TaxID=2502893 RepID=A0A4Q2ULK5_9BACT|nr:LysM peptidoglycan-binding domain-containing protein [Spirosoma sordidisoli]
MIKHWAVSKVLRVFLAVATCSELVVAQSLPEVPAEIRFGGATIYVSEPVRYQIQQEIRQIYANRSQLEQDVDALRQLTPLLQPYLDDADLAVDFRYAALPFSPAEPAYWSLSPAQAWRLGLRIDNAVDTRLHPMLATEAVATYIKRLQERSRGDAVQLLLRYVRASTSEPVPDNNTTLLVEPGSPPLLWKILARKIAVEHEEPIYKPAASFVVYPYRNSGGKSLVTIAKQLELRIDRFSPYNRWLKEQTVPVGDDYPVLIRLTTDEFPLVRAASMAGAASQVGGLRDVGFPLLLKMPYREEGLRSSAVFYKINDMRGVQAQPCENAITLAYYGDLSVKKFLDYNELAEQDVIWPGQVYYLERKAKRAKVPFHVVQRNQTLRDVSNMYGVRLSSLLRFNRLEPRQRVRAGRILWLQKKRPSNQPVEYQALPLPVPEPEPAPVADTLMAKKEPPRVDTTAQPPRLVAPTVTQVPRSQPAVDTAGAPRVAAPIARTPTPVLTTVAPVIKQPQDKVRIHVVKAGQTYYSIAKLYKVTPQQLYFWNNLSEKIPLEIGQELAVAVPPVRGASPSVTPPAPRPAPERIVNTYVVERPDKVTYHVVKPGQTVYRVALINNVTIPDLMRWNNLKNYSIEVGQRLIIRKKQ